MIKKNRNLCIQGKIRYSECIQTPVGADTFKWKRNWSRRFKSLCFSDQLILWLNKTNAGGLCEWGLNSIYYLRSCVFLILNCPLCLIGILSIDNGMPCFSQDSVCNVPERRQLQSTSSLPMVCVSQSYFWQYTVVLLFTKAKWTC